MVARGKAEKAQLKVRLHEPLRARLEAEAKEGGYSLNTEIVRRLETSIRDDDFGVMIFGSKQTFGMMDMLSRIVRGVELNRDKRWFDDGPTYDEAVEAIHRFLKNWPTTRKTGQYPGGLRDMADVHAALAMDGLIRYERAMSAEEAEQSAAPNAAKDQPRRARGRPRRPV